MLKFLFLILANFVIAQEGYPKPKASEKLLFYIQHSSNHNTFIYEKSSDKNQPISVSRINYEDKGQKESLTAIQRKFAYGVEFRNDSKTQFSLAAIKKSEFMIKTQNGKSWVELQLPKLKIKVDHIFIQLAGNVNGIKAKADYILVYGKTANNKSIVEKIVL